MPTKDYTPQPCACEFDRTNAQPPPHNCGGTDSMTVAKQALKTAENILVIVEELREKWQPYEIITTDEITTLFISTI